MSGPKRFNRNHRDANEAALLEVAERLGARVVEDGDSFDKWLWIPKLARFQIVEIKDPAKEGLEHEFTAKQLRRRRRFEEIGAPLWIWRTVADVVNDLA